MWKKFTAITNLWYRIPVFSLTVKKFWSTFIATFSLFSMLYFIYCLSLWPKLFVTKNGFDLKFWLQIPNISKFDQFNFNLVSIFGQIVIIFQVWLIFIKKVTKSFGHWTYRIYLLLKLDKYQLVCPFREQNSAFVLRRFFLRRLNLVCWLCDYKGHFNWHFCDVWTERIGSGWSAQPCRGRKPWSIWSSSPPTASQSIPGPGPSLSGVRCRPVGGAYS